MISKIRVEMTSIFCILLVSFLSMLPWSAVEGTHLYEDLYNLYPRSEFLIGIGEVNKTNNLVDDKRMAQVLARLDLAKQINVRIKSQSVDRMCSRFGKELYKDDVQCRDEVIILIEETVDEVLQGTRPVQFGERENIVFAAVVISRHQSISRLAEKAITSLDETQKLIATCDGGSRSLIDRALATFKRAVIFSEESEMLGGANPLSKEALRNIENKLRELNHRR